MGRVSPAKVILYHRLASPLLTAGGDERSFKPFFIGKFVVADGETALTGYFGTPRSVKVALALLFGLVAGIACLMASLPGYSPLVYFGAVLLGLLLTFGILAMVRMEQQKSLGDPEYIATVIRAALDGTD